MSGHDRVNTISVHPIRIECTIYTRGQVGGASYSILFGSSAEVGHLSMYYKHHNPMPQVYHTALILPSMSKPKVNTHNEARHSRNAFSTRKGPCRTH